MAEPDADAAAVAVHQARVDGFLGAGVFRKTIWRYDNAVGRMRGSVAKADDEVALSVVVVTGDMLRSWRADWCGGALLADLSRRALPWRMADVALLLRFVGDLDDANIPAIVRAAVSAAGRLDLADRRALVPVAQAVFTGLDRRRSLTPTERSRLRALLRSLLAGAGAAVDLVHAGDGWGKAAVARLPAAAGPFVAHLDGAAPTPTAAWSARAGVLLREMPDGHRLVHDLLTAVAAGDPADHADASGDFEPRWVGSDNGITVRGLLWSACALDAAAAGAAVPAIATAATLGRAVDERAVNAAIDVLGRRGPPGEAALRELQRTVQGPPRRVRRIAAAIGP